MNGIDYVWLVISGASAMLGVIHAVIWYRRRDKPANAAFAVAAVSLAVIVIIELSMMRARTPHGFQQLLLWSYVPVTTLAIGLVVYLLLEFRAGSRALAGAAIVVRIACMGLNFVTSGNLIFRNVQSLGQVPVWGGGTVSMPADAVPNPWGLLDNFADILLMLFIASVIVDLLRRPRTSKRQGALMVAWVMLLFVAFAFAWPFAVVHLGLNAPLVISPVFLLVLLAMGNELGNDALRVGQLESGLATATQDLADTRRQMDLAVHAGGIGLWNWDVVADQAWFSDTCLAMLGYPADAAVGMGAFRECLPVPDRTRFDVMLHDARAEGGAFAGEYRIVPRDGGTRWVVIRGEVQSAPGGAMHRVDAVLADITKRKAAEDRFRIVVMAAPTALLMFDAEGTITLANPQAEDVFGFAAGGLVGEAVGQVVPGVMIADPVDPVGLDAGIEAVQGATGGAGDRIGRRRDGSGFPIAVVLSPVPIESQVFMLAAITDLSEKRRFENELAMQRDELTHLSRVTLLSDLSGSLAHELNQPLTAVLANAQAAIRFLARDPPEFEQVRASLVDIVESDKRAGEVIRRLRALLRKDRTEFRPLDINDLIHGTLKIIRSDLLNKQIETVLELADDLPAVHGDAVQIQQVLLNLITNASDAMREAATRKVTLRTVRDGPDRIVVSVSDLGQGMPDLDPEKIFAPFFTTKPTGLGLGLPVCRTIVTAHHGRLWAEGHAGAGTTVSFSLPVGDVLHPSATDDPAATTAN